MKPTKEIEPLETNLTPVQKSAEHLSWVEARSELERINFQFRILHDLPKVDGKKPTEYMLETFEGLRRRCIAIHWRCIDIQVKRTKVRVK